jgi:N-acetylmuramoyl-L-alanine amidase
MADCISERRSNVRTAAVAAALALLTGVVSGAGNASSSTRTGASKAGSAKASPASPAAGKVTSVRFWSLGDVTRISIEVSSEFKYHAERLSEPDRLFFDIQGARPAMIEKGMHVINVGDALLKQIRVAETQPGVTRVVLDLETHDPRVEFTASQLSGPERLMVELRLASPDKEKSTPEKSAPPVTGSASGGARVMSQAPLSALAPDIERAPAPLAKPAPRQFHPPPESASTSVPKPARAEPNLAILTPPALGTQTPAKPELTASTGRVIFTPPPAPEAPAPPASSSLTTSTPPQPRKEPLPAKSNATGDQSLTRALGLKLGRVVIDAGHGGNDVGTHGPSGLLEKDVVLDVALKLGALLQERLGADVIYTRSNDSYVGLEERTQIANDHKADLFLSIHANSSPYPTVGGVEAYYLNVTTSKSAMDLAAKENASSQSTIFDLKDVLAKIVMKDKIDESREFASMVQTSLFALSSKSNATAKNRGIKKAPFVVLIGAEMPSVLAEIGFLTNSTDEALLRKPEQRQKIAEALYKGVASYADSLSHFQVAKRELAGRE